MSVLVRRATLADAAAYARSTGDPAVDPGPMQMPHTNEEIWRAPLAESVAPGRTDLSPAAERPRTPDGA